MIRLVCLFFLMVNLLVHPSFESLQESKDFATTKRTYVDCSTSLNSQNIWNCKRLISTGWTFFLLLGSSLDICAGAKTCAGTNSCDIAVRPDSIFSQTEERGMVSWNDVDICGEAYALNTGNLWMFKMRNVNNWAWVSVSPITKYGFELYESIEDPQTKKLEPKLIADKPVDTIKNHGREFLVYQYNVIETPGCEFKYRIVNPRGTLVDPRSVSCSKTKENHEVEDRAKIEKTKTKAEGGLIEAGGLIRPVNVNLNWHYTCTITGSNGIQSFHGDVYKGEKARFVVARHHGFCVDNQSVKQVVRLYTSTPDDCGDEFLGEVVLKGKSFEIKKETVKLFWTRKYFDPKSAYIAWGSTDPRCTEVTEENKIAVCEDGTLTGRYLDSCLAVMKALPYNNVISLSENQFVRIINIGNSLPLDIDGLQQEVRHNNENNPFQQWRLMHVEGDFFKLINRAVNLPLDVSGVQRETKHNDENNPFQQWSFVAT